MWLREQKNESNFQAELRGVTRHATFGVASERWTRAATTLVECIFNHLMDQPALQPPFRKSKTMAHCGPGIHNFSRFLQDGQFLSPSRHCVLHADSFEPKVFVQARLGSTEWEPSIR